MADMHDQAQAIWKTLDKMLEQDPEGYKKFITEQLESSKQYFMEATKAGNNILGEMVKFAPPEMGDLSGMGDSQNNSGLGKMGNNGPVKKSQQPQSKQPVSKVTPTPKAATDLTDDAFNMTSLLSSICPEEDDDSSSILEELRIPGTETKAKANAKSKSGETEKMSGSWTGTGKKKPLIEEL